MARVRRPQPGTLQFSAWIGAGLNLTWETGLRNAGQNKSVWLRTKIAEDFGPNALSNGQANGPGTVDALIVAVQVGEF